MTPWIFAHATDIHVGSPRSFRFAPAWNENWQCAREQMIEMQPDLLLLGGDVARDGNTHRFELEAVKADLDTLSFPYHVVAGNMDTGNKHTTRQGPHKERDDIDLNVTSEQLRQFAEIFGPNWWTFVHKDVRFSGFCDMILGSGLPEEKDLWDWLEAQRSQPRAKHHVWMMHYALFIMDPHETNYRITDPDEYFEWYFGINDPMRSRLLKVLKATGAEIVISGHVHCRKTHFAEGIRFDIGPSTAFPQWGDKWPDGDDTLGFLKYTVSDTGIAQEFVPLRRVSAKTGYGPGGHPKPEARDYSAAWER